MDTRQIANEYRLTHWTKIINDCRESGLSVKKYCESTGIHENTYFYWQKKLREATCQQMLVKNNSAEIIRSTTQVAPSGWISCEMAKSISGENAIHIEIGKCRISVDNETDVDLLTKVCRALVAI